MTDRYARAALTVAVALFLAAMALPTSIAGGFDVVEQTETAASLIGLGLLAWRRRWGAAVATALFLANLIEAAIDLTTGDLQLTWFIAELFIITGGATASCWALWIGGDKDA